MLIYFSELSLEAGFDILANEKADRLVRGRRVSAPPGLPLYQAVHASGQPLKCWSCGATGSCWVLNRGKNDQVRSPVLDLFAVHEGRYVLMTRDHIIPKSFGGVNDVENLRIGCTDCNGARGNSMTREDLEFMAAHPELIRSDVPPDTPTAAQLLEQKERRRKANQRRAARKKAKRAEQHAQAV